MKHICLFLFGALLAMGIPIGGAVTRDFTIDPTQSSVALSGDVAAITFKEQAPGSLSTSYSGTITLGLTDATVQITAGAMNAAVSGDWLPGPNGQGGAAPADYGAQASIPFGTATAALRNILLDLSSPTATLTNGSFDAGSIVFSFSATSAAKLDYNAGFLGSGSTNLAGNATNKTATIATLTSVGGTDTLVINIDATFKASLLAHDDSSLHILGKITAHGKTAPRFIDVEVVDHEIRFKIEGDITGFKLESTSDYLHWNERQPEIVIENNVPVYKLPATVDFEFFRFTS